jgi:hypothetical protein
VFGSLKEILKDPSGPGLFKTAPEPGVLDSSMMVNLMELSWQ